ncbi:MAG: hypothetical protein RI885_153 [Actinomycetota bacterium]|jgi:uridine kinase
MAQWRPAKRDTLEALAGEIIHNYARGGLLVAVDGGRAAATSTFADELAAVLSESRSDVLRVGIDDVRSAARGALVVADGHFLARADVAGSWHFLVWVDEPGTTSTGRTASRTKADALIDNRDPEHPMRVFLDAC